MESPKPKGLRELAEEAGTKHERIISGARVAAGLPEAAVHKLGEKMFKEASRLVDRLDEIQNAASERFGSLTKGTQITSLRLQAPFRSGIEKYLQSSARRKERRAERKEKRAAREDEILQARIKDLKAARAAIESLKKEANNLRQLGTKWNGTEAKIEALRAA